MVNWHFILQSENNVRQNSTCNNHEFNKKLDYETITGPICSQISQLKCIFSI
ncbi:hypothetical protein VCHA47P369_60106 [Vibrio chagasii]|nr:hypothetical protein VCHA36P168_10083 [Vibrio chagasii]CAH6850077.1 hypothetical protein VCHA28FP16_10435 [Vibrio chagasii]CAH6859902.1 hypothetical protein VCHA36P161_10498 [Vibrio chagasii]CAH6905470.1 hypothetical protein VCHA37O173_30318 [Vibrio chagasii]CAH6925267.1 hypothetical protein VCHA40O235_130044 [Vibrio chagasii]